MPSYVDPRRNLAQQRLGKTKRAKPLIWILLAVLAITILQDWVKSSLNSQAFYLSESFLFSLYWVLIPPIAFALKYALDRFGLAKLSLSIWTRRIYFVLAAMVAQILFFPLLVWLISALFYEHTFAYSQTLFYSVSEDLYKFLLIYAILSLLIFPRKIPKPPKSSEQLLIQSGRKTQILPVAEILCVVSATPYVEIHTASKKYLHQESLKSLAEKLDPAIFQRTHKSSLVNLKAVQEMKSRLNGDYDLTLSNGTQVRLSRNYAAAFKQAMDATSSA
ncbi:LytTR family DNA-binding domain-containing protein [Algoriphagus jejuensis]|uniref:LytTR family DNA-binding domain-containing protein n=1 Tax=Algoriphagus jejuensis TaxID=419934 RepID=A0ABN1MVU2_9BACT